MASKGRCPCSNGEMIRREASSRWPSTQGPGSRRVVLLSLADKSGLREPANAGQVEPKPGVAWIADLPRAPDSLKRQEVQTHFRLARRIEAASAPSALNSPDSTRRVSDCPFLRAGCPGLRSSMRR